MKEGLKEASKTMRDLTIASIKLRNPGQFWTIPSAKKGFVILDTNLTCEQIKLPNNCKINKDITDSYRGVVLGTITRNDEYIAALWAKTKYYMKKREALTLIEQLKELNGDNFAVEYRYNSFIINTDLIREEIILPEGVELKIDYYPSDTDNTYQCSIIRNGEEIFPGVINCKAKKFVKTLEK